MSATILDGKALAAELQVGMAARVGELTRPPGLAVILVGEDPASQVYVRNKGRMAEKLGFVHRQIDLAADTSEQRLLAEIDTLNQDTAIDGILVQFPLPKHLSALRVMDRINPTKDADGFTLANSGALSQGRPAVIPCTPFGVMKLLEKSQISLRGKDAVVIGRSNIVGRPMAMLLEQADCTVTIAHRHTKDLADLVRHSEIVIAAIGQPEWVRGEWIRSGAVVVDVGMNRLSNGRLTGDVEFQVAVERAQAITPVPGGVGPMTIAMLMENTLRAAERRLVG